MGLNLSKLHKLHKPETPLKIRNLITNYIL